VLLGGVDLDDEIFGNEKYSSGHGLINYNEKEIRNLECSSF
jgi:hypothetical protein